MSATKSAALLLSGGLDSTVLLHHLRASGRTLHALSFQYGQKHNRENECARRQAEQAGVDVFHVLDLTFLGPLLKDGSCLLKEEAPVPCLSDIAEYQRDQPPTYVPNRNMLLLSIAAAYAESHGLAEVYYGAQAQDEYGYWDCTPLFLERINALLSLNRRNPVSIIAPFMNHSKQDIVRLGSTMNVDFAETWSCYRGGKMACGECPTCIERLKAFAEAGVADPLPYVSASGSGT